MSDLYLDLGDDLRFGPSGDLLTVKDLQGDPSLTHQRIGRRFFTNPQETDDAGHVVTPADYIFHPTYGAGLPRLIDANITPNGLAALQRTAQAQAQAEPGVTQYPPPVATATMGDDGRSVDLFLQFYTPAGGQSTASFGYAP